MKKLNEVLLRRNKSIILKPSKNEEVVENNIVSELLFHISFYGYTFDKEVIEIIKTYSKEEIQAFSEETIDILKSLKGGIETPPLFKNFPNDVPVDEEYFLERVYSYLENILLDDFDNKKYTPLSCGHIINNETFDLDKFGACPICQMQVEELQSLKINTPLNEFTPLEIIKVSTLSEIKSIYENLITNPKSISMSDREDFETIFDFLLKIENIDFNFEIPNKENLSVFGNVFLSKVGIDNFHLISDKFKTATDILRLATSLSNDDISLSTKTKYKLSNPNRKLILKLLNELPNSNETILEDMLRHRNKWLKVGETIHPFKYASRFKRASDLFFTLRNDHKSINTFNKEIEILLSSFLNEIDNTSILNSLLSKLQERPGEFFRRLDLLLRKSNIEDNKKIIIFRFSEVIDKIETTKLLEIRQYFKTRKQNSDYRFFIPKGEVSKIWYEKGDNREVIETDTIKLLRKTIKKELIRRFSTLPQLGNVYISKELEKILIPLSLRDTNKSLLSLTKGSKIDCDYKKTIRLFVYWKENEKSGRIDVDLSAIAFDENWGYKTHLSYTSLKGIGGVHSGDIQSAPNGASEYIDLDIQKSIDNGIRYISMNVFSYTEQTFDTFECFAGIMEREFPGDGNVFEPKTVKNKFDISAKSTISIPMFFDLVENKIIWSDVSLKSNISNGGNNVESNKVGVSAVGEVFSNLYKTKPNIYDLIKIHVKARNGNLITIVEDNEKDLEIGDNDLFLNEESVRDINKVFKEWVEV